MKKILFLHSSSELYGSDKSLLNLVKNIDKNKFKIIIILPEDGPLVEEIKKLDNVEILIKEIAVLRRKNLSFKGIFKYINDFINSLLYLRKIVKKNNIDVIYTNTSVVFPGGVIAKLCGKKSIWHIREIISNKYERKVVSIIVNMFSDVIIANSKATAEAITNKIEKVKVVYNAIEAIEDRDEKDSIIKSDKITIGMAGRINRWKGQKLFVDMASEVIKKNPYVEFLIAGDVYKGEDDILEDLKEYISKKGLEDKIILLGQVKRMSSFYDKLDIFILPSIQPEPFGLVVIEAMDKGVPVVATNHGGPVEIISNNIDGFLVDYKNHYEMSNKVIELIEDEGLRKKIGEQAKRKREKLFSIQIYVENITKILEAI